MYLQGLQHSLTALPTSMAAVMNMHGGEANTLHPFFTRPNGMLILWSNTIDLTLITSIHTVHEGSRIPHENEPASIDKETTANEKLYDEDNTESTTQPKTKSRIRKTKQPGSRTQGQKTLAEVLNPPGVEAVLPDQVDGKPQDKHVTWDEHDDHGPRKRRRTNSFDINTVTTDSVATSEPTCNRTELLARGASPHVFIPPFNTAEADPAQQVTSMPPPTTPPKKMMKLNAGGKLSSPGGKAKEDGKQPDVEPRRRGRPRKVKEPEPPKSLLVVIRYASEDAREKRDLIGKRLMNILEGEERIPEPAHAEKKQRPSKKTKPAKPTHPFFNGKLDDKPAPRKLRSQTFHDRMPEPARDVTHAIESALLKDRLLIRHPGAREPMWPDRTQAHVRGLDDEPQASGYPYTPNKQKRKQFKGIAESSIYALDGFGTLLEPETEPEQRPDGFAGPRRDLRLPGKLLMSGRDVMKRVSRELRSAVQQPDEGELSGSSAPQSQVPPSVQKLYSALPNHLSAFDHCSGDTLGWTQKYAPTAAQDVLQTSGKMAVLKNWLLSLKVNTVEVAPSTQPAPKAMAKPKKKRRRRNDDMDDFLVDDDAEVNAVPDVVELEEPSAKNQLKSIVQTSNGSKVSNAVLLSGPHGCGKTASAYAVAKELGYQVFEISSAERRSGRDVVDRVGDMTENHIVRHHGVDPGEISASEDRSQMEAAFQKDLETGRQGKMSAFFKKQPEVKPKVPKVQQLQTKTVEKLQKALKQPAKDQQQSLILLEEVDVLFKEDKEFWTTVFRLLASSKRPFIMTCNDEDLVPLQAMSLHAILRFAAPPANPSVDLMLMIAAMEGHLLKREAVASLFESKNHDLRASIAELDFWCQMGVGDPKGGLSWIYQRYPPGSDVDEHGEKLRLISEDTYHDGMGIVQLSASVDEDAFLLAWREFGIEPTNVLGLAGHEGPEDRLQAAPTALPSSLKDTSKMADFLSAMDVYSTHDNADASLPETLLKSRANYIEGMALLDSNDKIDYSDTPARIAVTSAVLACNAFRSEAAAKDYLTPSHLLCCIKSASKEGGSRLSRRDFACFDAISMPTSASTNGGLELSAFDGPLPQLSTDLAPYVRSIAQYDLSLEEQRERLGEIMGEGHKAKRARTTRAARSALEGSQRGSTRRERWFTKELDLDAVLATGGSAWPKTNADVKNGETREGSEAPASSMGSVASTPREQ
jgi:DNA polymerase III delta prime subunit